MARVVRFIVYTIICILTQLSYGFVLSKMWGWFIVPIFHLVPLRVIPAIGIMMVICLIRPVFLPVSSEYLDSTPIRKKIGHFYMTMNFFYPWMALFFGWIVTFFMPV